MYSNENVFCWVFFKESKGEYKILFYYYNILDLNIVLILSLDFIFLVVFLCFFYVE